MTDQPKVRWAYGRPGCTALQPRTDRLCGACGHYHLDRFTVIEGHLPDDVLDPGYIRSRLKQIDDLRAKLQHRTLKLVALEKQLEGDVVVVSRERLREEIETAMNWDLDEHPWDEFVNDRIAALTGGDDG